MRIDADEVMRIAKAVARRYAARCWWADVDDLTGEASRAVLEARETWDPQVGVPFDGYAARAATNALGDYLWRQSSPVSGGLHNPRELIAGVHAAPLEDDSARHDPKTAMVLDDINWRLRVRKRIRQLAARTKDGHLAVEVLVRGRKPSEVIRETGGNAYSAVMLVMRKMREDAVLYELWQRTKR
jgi:DNA-directed RNA polymerase sigma subunit (sigma70/sigma32)